MCESLNLTKAAAKPLQLVASPWSPPAWMKEHMHKPLICSWLFHVVSRSLTLVQKVSAPTLKKLNVVERWLDC